MSKLILLSAGLFFAAIIGQDTAGAATETTGSVLAKLNKLPPEQRQKTLIERARAEGEVSFYSSLQAQQIDPFIQVFANVIRLSK